MEQRPHPSYDRATFRRLMACFVAIMLSGLGAWTAVSVGVARVWSVWLGGAGFLTATVRLLLTPINSCRCPTCGERLFRPPFTTEFPCGLCNIGWQTRVLGENILD